MADPSVTDMFSTKGGKDSGNTSTAVGPVGGALFAQNVKQVARWARVGVVTQSREDADSPQASAKHWRDINALFSASTESQSDEVFAAVAMYYLVNGASVRGPHNHTIKTAGGRECDSGRIQSVVGSQPGAERRLMRGRMEDSYYFLKGNERVSGDPNVASKAVEFGIPPDMVWVTADWMDDCPFFTPSEAKIHDRVRDVVLERARMRQLKQLPMGNTIAEDGAGYDAGTGGGVMSHASNNVGRQGFSGIAPGRSTVL